jgi:hypothetical protein
MIKIPKQFANYIDQMDPPNMYKVCNYLLKTYEKEEDKIFK